MDHPLDDPLVLVVQLAQLEAERFHHLEIDTPHVLLALLRTRGSLAQRALHSQRVHYRQFEVKLLEHLPMGVEVVYPGPDFRRPITPAVRAVWEEAWQRRTDPRYTIGLTGRLLLSLLRDPDSLPVHILHEMNASVPAIAAEAERLLGERS